MAAFIQLTLFGENNAVVVLNVEHIQLVQRANYPGTSGSKIDIGSKAGKPAEIAVREDFDTIVRLLRTVGTVLGPASTV